MATLSLKFASGPYDRMEALLTGQIKPEGLELAGTAIQSPREMFDRAVVGREFDVTEMSTSEHIAMHCAGDNPFVAIPVFPSKVFRHGFITINRNAGIREPKDLAGKRIGLPLYTQTAAIWCRGVLAEDYGVDLSGVTWVEGAVPVPGPHGSPEPPPLLKPVRIEQNETQYSLSELLARGDIDALIGAQLPTTLGKSPDVVRLFDDFRTIEKDYHARTGIHPIMHLMLIKREVYEANPWIAKAIYDACEAAKAVAWRDLSYSGAQKIMLPWLFAEVTDTLAAFDGDPWPYGIEKNRRTLEALIRHMYDQHMIARKPTLEELFVAVD
ncbi:MAG: hypothetical protein RLZ98_650 [Pseudomonadota bacterium]|jgi:4,5-dihydroxyphthalate decarboxylase